nr:MAG TPA: hypothetical protein [Caudoviricetes sp.]
MLHTQEVTGSSPVSSTRLKSNPITSSEVIGFVFYYLLRHCCQSCGYAEA